NTGDLQTFQTVSKTVSLSAGDHVMRVVFDTGAVNLNWISFDAQTGCTPESDTQFCSRLGKNCGSVTANDNCGASRTVNPCGTCTSPQTCGGGGTANVCGGGGGSCNPTVTSYTLGKCNSTAVFNAKMYKCISQAAGV